MVHRTPEERKALIIEILPIIVVLVVGVIGICFVTIYIYHCSRQVAVVDEAIIEEVEQSEETTPKELPKKVDFQPVVDEWAASTAGNKSVLIYDLERDEVAAEYNVDEIYNTASLYKIFVVYEGYRRVQSGEWRADEVAGYTGRTILECLDLSIRESNSACAETLRAKIGDDTLNEIIKDDFGIMNTDVVDLVSSAHDVSKMMQIFYEHKDVKDEELVARMKDSFLNQPKQSETEYDWRQGLPSGFSKATVYNKVGWDYNPEGYWNVYHDAAIVEFPEDDRHFVVVVMTNLVPYQEIRELGAKLELTYYSQ